MFTLFFFGSVVGFSLTTGLFLQMGLGFTRDARRLYLAAMAVGAFFGAGVGAWASTAVGRPILHVGLTIMAAGRRCCGGRCATPTAPSASATWRRGSSSSASAWG